LVTAILLAPLTTVCAQANDDERFSASLGIFITDRNSDTKIDGSASNGGTEVDLEGDLGLDPSNTVFRIDAYFKFNERHRIDFSWFDLSREATKQIQRDIEWNDTVFPIDTVLTSDFDLSIYKAAYTWSFLRRDKGFLGATAGVYVMDFTTKLEGNLIGLREVADITAPLPVIGLRGAYDLSDKWSFRGSAEVFLFEYEEWDGNLFDVYLGLDYQLFKKVALGIGVNGVAMDLDVSRRFFSGDVDWGYAGALVFLKFDF
jgi:hypothetical protein